MAEDLENALGEEIVNAALSDGTTPEVTFGSILNQITHFLDDYPEEERSSRRKKLVCVLEKKFSDLLKIDGKSSVLDVDRKGLIRAVADKIAAWMEDVIVEVENRIDSQCSGLVSSTGATAASTASSDVKTVSLQVELSDVYEIMQGSGSYLAVENIVRPRAPSEDHSTMTDVMVGLQDWEGGFLKGPVQGETDLRQWADWLDAVMKLTEDWASWINQTVTQAKDKAALKRGDVIAPGGEIERLTRADWVRWKKRVTKEGATFNRVNQNVQKTAEEWRKMFTSDSPTEQVEEEAENVE